MTEPLLRSPEIPTMMVLMFRTFVPFPRTSACVTAASAPWTSKVPAVIVEFVASFNVEPAVPTVEAAPGTAAEPAAEQPVAGPGEAPVEVAAPEAGAESAAHA